MSDMISFDMIEPIGLSSPELTPLAHPSSWDLHRFLRRRLRSLVASLLLATASSSCCDLPCFQIACFHRLPWFRANKCAPFLHLLEVQRSSDRHQQRRQRPHHSSDASHGQPPEQQRSSRSRNSSCDHFLFRMSCSPWEKAEKQL